MKKEIPHSSELPLFASCDNRIAFSFVGGIFMEETWKDVVGFEGLYQVSDKGNVRSLNYHSQGITQILKYEFTKGYSRVRFSARNKITAFSIHRLVAQAFIPNPENKRTVNHKNGIKTDNRVENLEWATYSENNKHSFDVLGRKGSKPVLGKFGTLNWNSKPVNQLTLSGEIVKRWECMCQISRELGYHQGDLSRCCNGKRRLSHGFRWEFANEII